MNKLLVPVDFSEVSFNALKYAYELAFENHSEIVLLNCFEIPARHVNVMIDLKDILEKDAERGLIDFEERVKSEFISDILIHKESFYGTLNQGIEAMVLKYQVDLVIMGTKGASSSLRKLIGTNSSSALKNVNCPFLIVPDGYNFSGWNHTVYATDFKQHPTFDIFKKFKKLINGMQFNLDVLHVIDNTAEEQNFEKLESKFIADSENKNVTFHYSSSDNATHGIQEYVIKNSVDLLVLIKHNYSYLNKLFHDSASKQLVMDSSIPVLVFQD